MTARVEAASAAAILEFAAAAAGNSCVVAVEAFFRQVHRSGEVSICASSYAHFVPLLP